MLVWMFEIAQSSWFVFNSRRKCLFLGSFACCSTWRLTFSLFICTVSFVHILCFFTCMVINSFHDFSSVNTLYLPFTSLKDFIFKKKLKIPKIEMNWNCCYNVLSLLLKFKECLFKWTRTWKILKCCCTHRLHFFFLHITLILFIFLPSICPRG